MQESRTDRKDTAIVVCSQAAHLSQISFFSFFWPTCSHFQRQLETLLCHNTPWQSYKEPAARSWENVEAVLTTASLWVHTHQWYPKVLENLQEVNKQMENNIQSLLKLSFSVSSPLLTATRAPCPRSEGDEHAGCSPASVRGTSTKAFRKRKPEKMLCKILPENQKYKP